MSYKLSLKIKQEFIATNERHEKEAKDRRDADSDYDTDDENEYLQTSVGNNIINDPAKLNLHTKASHHRGALSEDLHDAAWREDITLMKELIEKDPSLLEETDTGGQNLLHLSAFWGSLLVTEQLIKFGIDTDAVNIHAQRPLDIALQWGHVNVADVIRNAGGTSLFEDKILSVGIWTRWRRARDTKNIQLKKRWTRRDQINHRMAAAITTRAPRTTAAQAQKQ